MTTNFADIIFNEFDHTYTLNGQILTSVTRVIGQLKPVFNAAAAAARVATRDGRAVVDVLAEWEQKRQASMSRGTHVHKYIAAKILSSSETSPYDPAVEYLHTPPRLPEMNAFDRWWDDASLRTSGGSIELIIGDTELGVAGTMDAMFFNSMCKGTVIYDWKTGGKFAIDNPWENLLPPFDDLPNSEFSIYSLQTSLYRLIMERNSTEVEDCYIVHLGSDGFAKAYKALDLSERLEVWLNGR